jgi:hypothetical protein
MLSPQELIELTGYTRNADQRKWLTMRGWIFVEARNGRPVVSRAYFDSKMGAVSSSRNEPAPNFSKIRKAG